MCRIMGERWLDGSACMAAEVALKAMSGVVRDKSGEVGLVVILYGLRVRVSGLLMMMRMDNC